MAIAKAAVELLRILHLKQTLYYVETFIEQHTIMRKHYFSTNAEKSDENACILHTAIKLMQDRNNSK